MHNSKIVTPAIPWTRRSRFDSLRQYRTLNSKCCEVLKAMRISKNAIAIRNYCVVLGCATLTSLGIAEVYYQPSRYAQQEMLNGYRPYVGAGMVDYGSRAIYR